jgi:CRP/FNR family cyclic AMP-dependent transcriptional regulator
VDVRNVTRYAGLLRTGRWFQGLPDALQDALLRAAVVRVLPAGERLFTRGDSPCGLYAVVEGSVRISGVTDAGKEVLLTLAEPPSWFGEIAVFDRDVRTHDAVAHVASTLVRVPQTALDAILAAEPRYWRDLGLLLTSKLRLIFTMLEDLAVLPLGVRLARRLLLMADAYGEWQDRSRRVVDVRQEQLAMMLATSRQTMNALLKDYAAQGLVRVAYGQVEILDFDGLRRIAGVER